MLKYERISIKMNCVCEKQANLTVKKAETGKMTDYIQKIIHTDRLRTAYYRAGEDNEKKLVVLHGNISSSVFFLPLVPYLTDRYDIAVPDLRCFGNTEGRPVDARRGYRDWSDDVDAFVRALGWEHFTLLGWSMGGDIAMQYCIDHAEKVEGLVLVAPGSPFGFGGTRDEKGTMYSPAGLGSGGGTSNPALVLSGKLGGGSVMSDILNRFLFSEDFRMSDVWEKKFAKAAMSARLGTGYFPGDYSLTWKWPYVVAGDSGVLNAMSPKYGRLDAFLNIKEKMPVLWIRGNDDKIVSDTSMMELGYLGKIGLIPGWPGEDVYPPQPMVRQTRYFLEQYRSRGGQYVELVIPGGHVCILESPVHFITALDTFVQSKTDN